MTDEERRRVQISLVHSHIPKLADLNVLDYHVSEDKIVRARHTQQVQAVLNGAGAELDARQKTHAKQRDTDEQ